MSISRDDKRVIKMSDNIGFIKRANTYAETKYFLEITVNNKPTNILMEADSGNNHVHATLKIVIADFEHETYGNPNRGMDEIMISGNIRTFKKYIIEHWEAIRKWAYNKMIELHSELDPTITLLESEQDKKYTDPTTGMMHTRHAIEEEIKYLTEECDPNRKRKDGMTNREKTEQLKKLIGN